MPDAEPIDPLQWLALARKVARRFDAHTGPGLDRDDLRQEAYLALCTAARDYDGRIEFRKFAAVIIRIQLVNAADGEPRPLRLNRGVRRLLRALDEGRLAETDLSRRGRGCVADARRALAAGQIGEHTTAAGSLDSIPGREDDPSRGLELAEALAALDSLPERQRIVIRTYLGLDGGGGLIFREVGAVVGLSRQSTMAIYARGMETLRQRLGAVEG